MKILVVLAALLLRISSAQIIKQADIDAALRLTREQLGLDVEVIGKSGYSPSGSGTNLTFVLIGR
jgi:hypothetical protein